MYVLRITGEQLVREISKRQEVREDAGQPPAADRRGAMRRRTPSQPVPCRVFDAGGAGHKSALLNFSDGGALLQGPLPLAGEGPVEVFVSFPDTGDTFSLQARVVHRRGDHHIGVQFT